MTRGHAGRLALLLAALLLGPGTALSAKKPQQLSTAPQPVGLRKSRTGGYEHFAAVFPGPVVAYALPRAAGGGKGRRLIALLVAPEPPALSGDRHGPPPPDLPLAGARSLVLLDLEGHEGAGALRLALQGLPAESESLAAMDLDGDGVDELVMGVAGSPGRLLSLGPVTRPRAPRLLMEGAEIEPGLLLRSILSEAGAPLAAPTLGKLRLLRPDGHGGLATERELPLPVHASRTRYGLKLTSPRARPVGGSLWAAGPEAVGRERLRTLLLDPDAPPESPPVEAWSRLPGPETVDASWYARLDGRPCLMVATYQADHLGIFEKAKLRVFALGADRTRGGRPPLLSLQTASRRWSALQPIVADLDRDGHDDLLVLQQEGLSGGTLLAEAFFGRGGGRFETPSRKTRWELEAWSWRYDADLTGDGRPDLLLLAGNDRRLLILAAAPDPRSGAFVRSARALLPFAPEGIPEGAEPWIRGPLDAADLDGDGRPELLAIDPDRLGRGRALVVRLP